MSLPICIVYNQLMLLPEVKHDDGIWCISVCKLGTTLITCEQHSGLVSSTALLSTYRYIRILYCFIALCDDSYTNYFIFNYRIAHITFLQGSYLLIFCSYLTLKTNILKLNVLDPVIAICYVNLMFSLDPNDGLLKSMSQVIYHLVSQLLSNLWKYHVTAVQPKVFCF